MLRLSKLMAQREMCSRREADEYISQSSVVVDGEVVNQLGITVSPSVHIELLPSAQYQQQSKLSIILNKPVGYVSTQPEKRYVSAITLITPENQVHHSHSLQRFPPPDTTEKLAVIGRLDIDSKGLLLFSQDGRIAKKIIGPQSSIEKEYLVRVKGNVDSRTLSLLRHGLSLDGTQLKHAQVKQLNESQLQFILTEGKKRQIRRMCQSVGLDVIALKRVRIGPILLGGLKTSSWRYLTDSELHTLLNTVLPCS